MACLVLGLKGLIYLGEKANRLIFLMKMSTFCYLFVLYRMSVQLWDVCQCVFLWLAVCFGRESTLSNESISLMVWLILGRCQSVDLQRENVWCLWHGRGVHTSSFYYIWMNLFHHKIFPSKKWHETHDAPAEITQSCVDIDVVVLSVHVSLISVTISDTGTFDSRLLRLCRFYINR